MLNYRMLATDNLQYVTVARTDELANGQRILLDVGGRSMAVFNIAGSYFAIDDVCSHDDGPVAEGEVIGEVIECPRHGGRFDLKTGKAVQLPAVADIGAYPVRIVGDEIQVGLPLT
jgi:3-phenylpropionate/trans-cinnamate dioxygenase ferredoxin subunit